MNSYDGEVPTRAWKQIAGTGAYEFCGGGDGSMWHMGKNLQIYKWNGAGWTQGPPCSAAQMARGRPREADQTSQSSRVAKVTCVAFSPPTHSLQR